LSSNSKLSKKPVKLKTGGRCFQKLMISWHDLDTSRLCSINHESIVKTFHIDHLKNEKSIHHNTVKTVNQNSSSGEHTQLIYVRLNVPNIKCFSISMQKKTSQPNIRKYNFLFILSLGFPLHKSSTLHTHFPMSSYGTPKNKTCWATAKFG
jgi:hypothetical protein